MYVCKPAVKNSFMSAFWELLEGSLFLTTSTVSEVLALLALCVCVCVCLCVCGDHSQPSWCLHFQYWAYHHTTYCTDNSWVHGLPVWETRVGYLDRHELLCRGLERGKEASSVFLCQILVCWKSKQNCHGSRGMLCINWKNKCSLVSNQSAHS